MPEVSHSRYKKSPERIRGLFMLSGSPKNLGFLGGNGLNYCAGTDATGANAEVLNFAGRKLVTYALQVGQKTTLGFDVGMGNQVTGLGLLSTDGAFFRHGDPPYIMKKFGLASSAKNRNRL